MIVPLFDAYRQSAIVNEAARQLYEREGWTLQADFCVYNLALT